MLKEEFEKIYEDVFNLDGSIKMCGREACKKLIKACNHLDPDTYFGNPKTGILMIENIQNLRDNLLNNNFIK